MGNLCSLHISSNKNISKIQIMQAMILSTHLVKLRHAFLPSARYRCLVSSIFPRRTTETVNPIPVLEQRDISRLPSIRTFHTNFFLQQYDRTLYENSVLDGPTKYYIDLKEGNDGKYVKISEKSRGKRSTIMVNLEILSSFTSKLMLANSGEKVDSLKTEKKSYDFRKKDEFRVIVTESSVKPFNIYISCESIQLILKNLCEIQD